MHVDLKGGSKLWEYLEEPGYSGLEIERGLMILRNRKELRIAGIQ